MARGTYTRYVQEIVAAYIANPPTAVSNNWLPRQVHIPSIMRITAPYTGYAGRTGYRRCDTLLLLLQIYLSPSRILQWARNRCSVSIPSRFGPFHTSEIDICNTLCWTSLNCHANACGMQISMRPNSIQLLIASLSSPYNELCPAQYIYKIIFLLEKYVLLDAFRSNLDRNSDGHVSRRIT